MLTLMCNVLLTRRQEMCFIQDRAGVLLWSGREVFDAFTWLMENEHYIFRLVDGSDEKELHVTVKPV